MQRVCGLLPPSVVILPQLPFAEPNTAPGGSPIRGFPLAATEETDDEGDVVIVQRPPVRGVLGHAARCVLRPPLFGRTTWKR